MTTIQTRAGRVAYRESGSGPTVLLLHATLHDRHDFDPIVETLARRYRTIAVDWPGHGDSDPVDADHGAQRAALRRRARRCRRRPGSVAGRVDRKLGRRVRRRAAGDQPSRVRRGSDPGQLGRVRSVESTVPHVLPGARHAGGVPPGRSPLRPRLHEGQDRQRPRDQRACDRDGEDGRRASGPVRRCGEASPHPSTICAAVPPS